MSVAGRKTQNVGGIRASREQGQCMRASSWVVRVMFVQPVVLALGQQAVRQLCYARSSDAVAKHHAATR
jgi:hypothetical protein